VRKLKIIEHISLDGVIQAPGGPTEDGDYPHRRGRSPHQGYERAGPDPLGQFDDDTDVARARACG
jgi:hypothetical protein